MTIPRGVLLEGRYRTLEYLGSGAIAEVHRVHDELIDLEVAAKVLHESLAEQAAVLERFRREVAIVRRIEHPNVVRIFELVEAQRDADVAKTAAATRAGEAAQKTFLVMEYVPGGDLKSRLLLQGPLAVDSVIRIGASVADALGAAHRMGVVHRDVKPHNVLFGDGHAKLTDFGLACAGHLAGLHGSGALLGTPEYTAPELITQGRSDPRSDLYSLGVMLYELLVGDLPFCGDSAYEVLRMQVEAEPVSPRKRRGEIPEWLDELLLRMLAKDPAERPQTADIVAQALREPSVLRFTSRAVTVPRRCTTCEGPTLEKLGLCFRCGAAPPQVDLAAKGRYSVLVVGPGEPAEKFDHGLRRNVIRLLESFPSGSLDFADLKKQSPRLPFVLMKQLDAQSAEVLRNALRAVGVESQAFEGSVLLRNRDARKRAWRMSGRGLAIVIGSTVPALHAKAIVALPVLAVATALITSFRAGRAAVRRTHGALENAHLVAQRLAYSVGALESAELAELARMLFGHAFGIIERHPEIASDLVEALSPVAGWFKGLAAILAKLESESEREAYRRMAEREEREGVLDDRRELERTRDLLYERILVAASRVEALELRLGQADAARTEVVIGEVSALGDELSCGLAAESELRAFLGGR